MYIEIHILQNFPPSNLNRDDTGSPKDCQFGGVRRARISSQCLKRTIRHSAEFLAATDNRIGIRSKRIADRLEAILKLKYSRKDDDARIAARAIIKKMLGWDKKHEQSSVLFYASHDDIDFIAGAVDSNWDAFLRELRNDSKKTPVLDKLAKEIADRDPSVAAIDIALFGRMLAEMPKANVDAACQVAHAISTNQVDMDFDYFTAVDDLNERGDTGAGMIGTTGFNSSCFYRYALVDFQQLKDNLGGDVESARKGVEGFLRASVTAIPTGKTNSFAPQTLPFLVMAVVRKDRSAPWSLVNAFERPVYSNNEIGLVAGSIQKLDRHWQALCNMYGSSDVSAHVVVLDDSSAQLDSLSPSRLTSIDELVSSIDGHLNSVNR